MISNQYLSTKCDNISWFSRVRLILEIEETVTRSSIRIFTLTQGNAEVVLYESFFYAQVGFRCSNSLWFKKRHHFFYHKVSHD